MTVRPPVLSAFCAGILLLTAATHPATADEALRLQFEGFGPAGLHVLTTQTTIEEEPLGRYQINGEFATAGLGALFANVANHSMARGRQVGDTPRPELFDSQTDRNGVVQHNRVDFQPNGLPAGSSTPAPKE